MSACEAAGAPQKQDRRPLMPTVFRYLLLSFAIFKVFKIVILWYEVYGCR
jgi:hypothetical protein